MRVYQRLLQILRLALFVPHLADALAENISTVGIPHRESGFADMHAFFCPIHRSQAKLPRVKK